MSFLSRMKLIYQISLIGLAALSIFAIVAMVLFVADYQRQTAETTAEEAVDDRLIVDGIAREFLNARRREKTFCCGWMKNTPPTMQKRLRLFSPI